MLELWSEARTLPPSVPDTAEAVREALGSLLIAEDGDRVVGVSAVVRACEEHADALWEAAGYVHHERANRYVRNL